MFWQNGNVYVMDNHRDAAWCWLQQCNLRDRYNFMHVDQHYDLLDTYYSEAQNQSKIEIKIYQEKIELENQLWFMVRVNS